MGDTIVILHQSLPDDALPDDKDVLIQAAAISAALTDLGYETATIPFDLDIHALAAKLGRIGPLCVFNLVESHDGDGRLIHLACSILDHLDIPYTGASAEAMFITSNKVLAKRWMLRSGIPTPEWIVPGKALECVLPFSSPYIVKTLWEEASIGIDTDSVQNAVNLEDLLRALEQRSHTLGKKCFAERYIDGREFNLSIIGGKAGIQVLPPAEITFSFPDERPRIVDYKAKWDEDSLEYRSTVRTFEFGDRDRSLLDDLRRIAHACWEAFDLRGYARVDFRVDKEGRPWVLEINANPCISPDSGFVAASAQAGMSYTEVISRVLSATVEKGCP